MSNIVHLCMANNWLDRNPFSKYKTKIKKVIRDFLSSEELEAITVMIHTYFHIDKMIIQEQQQGNERAGYAEEIIVALSRSLSAEYGKGYSTRNLEFLRKFYILYKTASDY